MTSELSTPNFRIYAELLPNIRTITLLISCPASILRSLRISDSGEQLHIHFSNGNIESVTLPGIACRISLPIMQSDEDRTLQFRIPLRENIPSVHSQSKKDNLAAWSVEELANADSSIYCRNCGGEILQNNKMREWRALPSAGWAEMMDLWHCHKPEDEEEDKPGYTSRHIHKAHGEKGGTLKQRFGKGFIEESGVGLVGLTEFMLFEGDCDGLEVKEISGRQVLHCSGCGLELGDIAQNNPHLRRLMKWNLSVSLSPGSQPKSYSIIMFFAAHLLDMIDDQAVRHFYLTPPATFAYEVGIRIWAFNPEIYISVHNSSFANSSNKEEGLLSRRPFKAMKVFYRIEPLGREGFKEEVLTLPITVWRRVKNELEEANAALPLGDRKWNGWSVGWLRRF